LSASIWWRSPKRQRNQHQPKTYTVYLREELEGMIQQRYGLARDMVRKDVDAWLKSQP
jgi:hypothetical protein